MEATAQVRRMAQAHTWWSIPVALACGWTAAAAAQTSSTQPTPAAPQAEVKPADPKGKYSFDKDHRFIADFARNVRDPSPLRGPADDPDESDTYNALVLHANKFNQVELIGAARRDVSYGDFFAKGKGDYRFELVRFEGRLKRLRKIEPNAYLRGNGVPEIYEAWIVPVNESNPMCFVLTEKPAGIEPQLEYSPSYPVTAAGYFFKLLAYESKEPSEKTKGKFLTRHAPLLMAKSLTVGPVEDSDGGGPWREVFLPGLLTFLGLFTAFALGVTWYFRRGDRRSIQVLESKKANPFQEDWPEPTD